MAGQLAREELCEQGGRTTPASPMHVDMIARVEGLPNVTQSSLGGCPPTLGDDMVRAYPECEHSFHGRTCMNSHDVVGGIQASYRTEAVSQASRWWRSCYQHLWLRGLQARSGGERRPDDMGPS